MLAQPSAFPATPPTATQPPTASAAPAGSATPATPVRVRAQVVYSEGQLSITADNSSLNQILRDISRQTGMKITGGVTEQRVFGKYGPGSPSAILATLIEGTGSNMLLRYGPSHVPAELVLSPRSGGPSPPSPNAPQYNDASDDQFPAPPSNVHPGQSPDQSQQATPRHPASQGAPASSYFVDSPEAGASSASAPEADSDATQPASADQPATPPSSNATYPPSPNGVKTPSQINQGRQQLPQ